MKADLEVYVRGCHICAIAKPHTGKPLELLQTVADPTRPWEDIAMDFIVELLESHGYTVIWTIIDTQHIPRLGLTIFFCSWKLENS